MVNKTSQKTRDELGRMYRDERSDERCALKSRLYNESVELTGDIDDRIDGLVSSANLLRGEKEQMLKKAGLLGISENPRGGCSVEKMHPELLEFDLVTVEGRRKILNQD